LPNANEMIKLIKKAAVEAVEASKPISIMFGKVTSKEPLQINIEQKMTLGSRQLIIPASLTDHKMIVDMEGEEKEIEIKNGLVTGDNVILLRMQGGQTFLVLERVI